MGDLEKLDEEEIEAIQKLTTFEAMKKDPRTNYEHWDTFGIRNADESKFMRSGEVGNYKKYLHPETDEKLDQWIKEESSKLHLFYRYEVVGNEFVRHKDNAGICRNYEKSHWHGETSIERYDHQVVGLTKGSSL